MWGSGLQHWNASGPRSNCHDSTKLWYARMHCGGGRVTEGAWVINSGDVTLNTNDRFLNRESGEHMFLVLQTLFVQPSLCLWEAAKAVSEKGLPCKFLSPCLKSQGSLASTGLRATCRCFIGRILFKQFIQLNMLKLLPNNKLNLLYTNLEVGYEIEVLVT